MTQIKNFNYNENTITAIAIDTTNGQYLWVAHAKNTSNVCTLKKLSAHNPSQVFYDIDISVDEIVKMQVYNGYLYLAYDDTSYIGGRYNVSTPLTTNSAFAIPSGIVEEPIDLIVDSTGLYYLTAGLLSGTNAKISKFTTAGVHTTNIDLTTTTNAKSVTIDSNEDLWVSTYGDPAKLVWIEALSGGIYTDTDITID